MPGVNTDIADQLEKLADLLDIEGANPFRVRAYRNAARVIGDLPRAISDMLADGQDLDDLPGIGRDLADKIARLARGEKLPLLDELQHEFPVGITELLALPGLGPKRVHILHDTLGIGTIEELAAAARAGRLRSVPGLGIALETKLLRAIGGGVAKTKRTGILAAEQIVAPLLRHLRQATGVEIIEVAGSFRRRRDTVGDLDIVAAADPPAPVMQHFIGYEDVVRVIGQGSTRATVILRNGLQVDLRVVSKERFGTALCYFTGSKPHNIALRQIAVDHGWKLNEYGLFKDGRLLAGETETALYQQLGLAYIPPELREARGEIDAARSGRLPRLVNRENIVGDLHVHTNASDGRASLLEMVRAAQARGYEYVAITDHSRRVAMARGLDAKRLARQIEDIDRINQTLSGFVILKSIEVDILEDGRLDLPNEILRRLDLVVGSVHAYFDLPEVKQTERLLRAMDNRCLDLIAHPTGRLINARQGYAVDMDRIMRGAKERGCHLEVNAQPDRLDLADSHCRRARELGLKVAISTDAHAEAELDFMRFGIDQARRGWLTADDVLNTRSLPELRRLLRPRT